MKVLITGASGFVGAAVLKKLLAQSIDTTSLVRKKSSACESAKKIIVDDLVNLKNDSTTLFDGIDVVIHSAARVHIMNDEALDPLEEYRRVNRDATINFARLAAESGVQRFVFISSVKVNGEFTHDGTSFGPEVNTPSNDPYGLSKYEAEQSLLQIAEETGMEVVIIRLPLVYGEGVKGNFASMIKWVKRGVPLPLACVNNLRSLIALDNLVDFIVFCSDKEKSPKAANEVFLVSDGEDVSTSVLLKKIASAYGVKPRLLPIPVGVMMFCANLLGKGDVADRLFGNLQVDSSKACDLLGWMPVITMDEQLAKMAEVEGYKS